MMIDPRFSKTVFVVEANSFESLKLWEEFHEEYEWEQDNPGALITVGQVNDMPVNICIFWNKLKGHLVAFWDPVSRMVDHKMIENWFDENCNPKWDKGTRQARIDAMNFHHVVQCIDELEENNGKD
jgi:hypothetical protein